MSDRHEQPKPGRDHRATSDQRRGDDDRLASLLRDADPAVDQDVLAPAKLAAMRRTLIAAADVAAHSNPWRLWTPRLQTALPVAAAAGTMALALWMLGPTVPAPVTPDSPAPQAEPSGPAPAAVAPGERSAAATAAADPAKPSSATSPAAPPQDAAPSAPIPEAAAPATVVAEARVGGDSVTRPEIAGPPPLRMIFPDAESATVDRGDASPPRESTRTVQFVAPGGTRIIWTIDPDFKPPIAGPSARQESGK